MEVLESLHRITNGYAAKTERIEDIIDKLVVLYINFPKGRPGVIFIPLSTETLRIHHSIGNQ